MNSSLVIFVVGAALIAAAAFWVLRAYRRNADIPVRPAPALMTCGLAAAAVLGLYLAIGRPDAASAAYAARLEILKQRDPTTYNADEALAILSEASRDSPRDPLPHFYSGQVLLESGRNEEAARAFDAALRRDPNSAEALLGLGRALVRVDEGHVSPEALQAFERASALSEDSAPWIYQAMAAMQEDRGPDAARLWGEAYARMTPDDPRRAMAQRMSAEAGR